MFCHKPSMRPQSAMDDRSYRATAEVLYGVMKLLHIVACQRNKACFYEARLMAYKAKNLPRFMVFAPNFGKKMERVTGIEPATITLAT